MNPPSTKPFKSKNFFLDLSNFSNSVKLRTDLELLGAKEVFSIPSASFVVSDRAYAKSDLNSSNPRSISPLFSPVDRINSPVLNSPCVEQKPLVDRIKPMSRGMSMLLKASEKVQGSGYKKDSVIDLCKRWNIKIYPVQKVVQYVEKYKAKYLKIHVVKKKQEALSIDVQKIVPPFIKVEDHKRYFSMNTWQVCFQRQMHRRTYIPRMVRTYKEYLDTAKYAKKKYSKNGGMHIISPYDRQYKPKYKALYSSRLVDTVLYKCVKTLARNAKPSGSIKDTIRPVLQELSVMTQISRNEPYKTEAVSITKPLGYNSVSTCLSVCPPVNNGKQEKKNQSYANKSKKDKKKIKKEYCEICQLHYGSGESHYEKGSHKRFLENSENYAELEDLISTFPSAQDFLAKFEKKDESQKENFADDIQLFDGPLSMETSSSENNHNLPKDILIDDDACITETYHFNEDEFISSSCSCPSTPLPYLEDQGRYLKTSVMNSPVSYFGVTNSHVLKDSRSVLSQSPQLTQYNSHMANSNSYTCTFSNVPETMHSSNYVIHPIVDSNSGSPVDLSCDNQIGKIDIVQHFGNALPHEEKQINAVDYSSNNLLTVGHDLSACESFCFPYTGNLDNSQIPLDLSYNSRNENTHIIGNPVKIGINTSLNIPDSIQDIRKIVTGNDTNCLIDVTEISVDSVSVVPKMINDVICDNPKVAPSFVNSIGVEDQANGYCSKLSNTDCDVDNYSSETDSDAENLSKVVKSCIEEVDKNIENDAPVSPESLKDINIPSSNIVNTSSAESFNNDLSTSMLCVNSTADATNSLMLYQPCSKQIESFSVSKLNKRPIMSESPPAKRICFKTENTDLHYQSVNKSVEPSYEEKLKLSLAIDPLNKMMCFQRGIASVKNNETMLSFVDRFGDSYIFKSSYQHLTKIESVKAENSSEPIKLLNSDIPSDPLISKSPRLCLSSEARVLDDPDEKSAVKQCSDFHSLMSSATSLAQKTENPSEYNKLPEFADLSKVAVFEPFVMYVSSKKENISKNVSDVKKSSEFSTAVTPHKLPVSKSLDESPELEGSKFNESMEMNFVCKNIEMINDPPVLSDVSILNQPLVLEPANINFYSETSLKNSACPVVLLDVEDLNKPPILEPEVNHVPFKTVANLHETSDKVDLNKPPVLEPAFNCVFSEAAKNSHNQTAFSNISNLQKSPDLQSAIQIFSPKISDAVLHQDSENCSSGMTSDTGLHSDGIYIILDEASDDEMDHTESIHPPSNVPSVNITTLESSCEENMDVEMKQVCLINNVDAMDCLSANILETDVAENAVCNQMTCTSSVDDNNLEEKYVVEGERNKKILGKIDDKDMVEEVESCLNGPIGSGEVIIPEKKFSDTFNSISKEQEQHTPGIDHHRNHSLNFVVKEEKANEYVSNVMKYSDSDECRHISNSVNKPSVPGQLGNLTSEISSCVDQSLNYIRKKEVNEDFCNGSEHSGSNRYGKILDKHIKILLPKLDCMLCNIEKTYVDKAYDANSTDTQFSETGVMKDEKTKDARGAPTIVLVKNNENASLTESKPAFFDKPKKTYNMKASEGDLSETYVMIGEINSFLKKMY